MQYVVGESWRFVPGAWCWAVAAPSILLPHRHLCTPIRWPTWSVAVGQHSGYRIEELAECAAALATLHRDTGLSSLTAGALRRAGCRTRGVRVRGCEHCMQSKRGCTIRASDQPPLPAHAVYNKYSSVVTLKVSQLPSPLTLLTTPAGAERCC